MRRSVLAALAAVANIYFQFGCTGYHEVDAEQNPLLHTWSLGVEEQFYLAIALLFVLLWRLARRAAPVMVIVATGISFVFWIMMIRGGGSFERPDSIAFYSTFARVWEFGVGLLLALTIIQRQVPALIVALAWFVLAASMVIPETHDVLLPVVVVASGTLLIAALSFRFAARSSGSVIVRTAGTCGTGRSSFSGVLLCPISPTTRSLRHFCRSFLRASRTVSSNSASAADRYDRLPRCCSSPALAPRFPLRFFRHADATSRCRRKNVAELPRSSCELHSGQNGLVVLLGDSNAGHFTEAVQAASVANDSTLLVSTASACSAAIGEALDR